MSFGTITTIIKAACITCPMMGSLSSTTGPPTISEHLKLVSLLVSPPMDTITNSKCVQLASIIYQIVSRSSGIDQHCATHSHRGNILACWPTVSAYFSRLFYQTVGQPFYSTYSVTSSSLFWTEIPHLNQLAKPNQSNSWWQHLTWWFT